MIRTALAEIVLRKITTPTMKNFVLILMACACVSALVSAEIDNNKSKPPASLAPPSEFGTTDGTSAKTPAITTADTTTTTSDTPTTTAGTPNITTSAPIITTSAPIITTSAPNITTSAPNITTSAPNITTSAPNITTSAPNITTSAPNITTSSPNITTSAPNITTTAPVTALPPKPTPSANVTVGWYSMKTDKGVLCLIAHMALQIKVERAEVNGTFIVQPDLTHVEGSCEPPKANLTLAFNEGFITLLFNKNTTENAVYVNAVSFSLSYPFSSGDNPYHANNMSVRLFAAKIGHSYSCKTETLFLGDGQYLDVTQDRMQAFNLTGDKDFGSPEPCAAERQDYRVAIAVGIVLLVLIVIVVIAYLLGRRKRDSGYQSL